MLFDMGIGELLLIGVVGLIIFGPDRLPKAAAQAAQFLRQLKVQADEAKAQIMDAADIDASTLKDLRDLDPRRALRDIASPIDAAGREVRSALRDVSAVPKRAVPDATATPAAPDADQPVRPVIEPDDIV